MKTWTIAAILAGILSAPAFAAKITVEFTDTEGSVFVATFDDEAMTVTSDGNTTPYTVDPETRTICGADPEGELCVTFAAMPEAPTVGFETGYETNRGTSGTAKVTAVE